MTDLRPGSGEVGDSSFPADHLVIRPTGAMPPTQEGNWVTIYRFSAVFAGYQGLGNTYQEAFDDLMNRIAERAAYNVARRKKKKPTSTTTSRKKK